jgi:tetratricopeptide (TPR) repeat protein
MSHSHKKPLPLKKQAQHKPAARVVPKAPKAPKAKPTAPTYSLNIDDRRWLRILAILSGVVLLALLFVATQSGVTGDERIDGDNGKYYLQYYTESDTSFANYPKNVPNGAHPYGDLPFHMKYYGGGYEILPAIAVKYLNLPQHEFLIRHLLCALFGFVFMLFAALTARELKDSLLACITLLVMALTPIVFGWSMFATKDIPHAAGYAVAIFAFIRILKRLPRFKWQDVAMAIVGIAMATSIRIGGLLLVGYLGVGALLAVAVKKSLRENLLRKPYTPLCKVILVLGGVGIAGVLLGLCLYPNFFYEGPVAHVKNALSLASKFPQRIPMLWEGRQIDSLNLPDGYLLKSFAITIPVFALGAFFLFFCNIRPVWKTMDKAGILLLLFTIFFPIFYILYQNAHLYNFWRHLTFIYSSFAVVAATGIYYTLFWVKKAKYAKAWRCAFSGVVAILMATVLVWMVRSYKYTYAYFNVFAQDPYMRYDMDYFETANVLALEWLVKNELKNRDDTVKVAVRNINSIVYAKSKQYNNIQQEKISYRSVAEADVDYAILTVQFTPPNVLKTTYPPKGVIHAENVNGKPICVVVKKNKLDTRGIRALKENRIDEGMKLLEEAGAYDPTNIGVWFWMGYGYFQQQKYDKAIRFFTAYLNLWPHNEQIGFAKMYIGASQVNLKQTDAGIQTLQEAAPLVTDVGNKKFIDANLGIAYFNKQSYAQALTHLKNAVDFYPHLSAFIAQANLQINGSPAR